MSAGTLSRQLFVRIVPTLFAIVAGVGILAFHSSTQEINKVYDAQMISDANVLWQIVADEVKEAETEGAKGFAEADFSVGNQLALNDLADDYTDAHMFRVWRDKKIVMFSHTALPQQVPPQQAGFSEVQDHGASWRIYALPLPGTVFSIEVGEKHSLRKSLVDNILLDLLLPLLFLLPCTGILIWLGINSGLGKIRNLVQQIQARSPDFLMPIDVGSMPRDLAPLGESLNQLLEKLERSFTAEKRFVDDAAHHLRTPLAVLKLQLQMLSQTTDTDERSALVNELQQSNDRASKLVDQPLVSARLGHQQMKLKPTPLYQAASSIMAELGVLATRKHIQMSLEGGENAQVMAEDALLRLLLMNVVENAIKYSPDGGKVEVRIAPAGSGWKISVTDTGPGIPEDQRAHVFERFYRLDWPEIEGSGLGLSMVAEIVKKFSGSISLKDPVSGTGLLAEVTLPGA